MASTRLHRLGDYVDEAMSNLLRPSERPLQTVVGDVGLNTANSTTLTLADAEGVGVSTLLEHQDELMLVTHKTDDPTPLLTVARGYTGTPVRFPLPPGAVVRRDPPFPRAEVARWIRRSFLNLEAHLPRVVSGTFFRTPGRQYIEMPPETLNVMQVRHMGYINFKMVELGGWEFEENIPNTLVASGKIVRLPQVVVDEDELIVTYQMPYTWEGTGTEDDTIEVPVGADDLPVLYASAYGQMRREVSRAELDKIEEWNQEQAIRAGVNLRLVRDLWGEYYRRLDEARRVHRVPVRRPYVKRAKVW